MKLYSEILMRYQYVERIIIFDTNSLYAFFEKLLLSICRYNQTLNIQCYCQRQNPFCISLFYFQYKIHFTV